MSYNDGFIDPEPTVPTVEDILMCCRHSNARPNIQYQGFGYAHDYEEHIHTIETLLLALLETLTDDQKITLQNKITLRGV